MRRIQIPMLFVLGIFLSNSAAANAYTDWSTIEYVERVNNGILIKAPGFQDVNSCGVAGFVYYPKTNHDYEFVASMMLTALAAEREVRFFITSCGSVSWHWGGNVINQATSLVFVR